MDNDDLPIGRVLSRREAVRLVAAGSLFAVSPWDALFAQSAMPGCVVKPESTEGPYFVDKQLDRSDVRTEPGSGVASAGAPLALAFAVSQIANSRCTPLPQAVVDIWQCDALGVYSGVTDGRMGFNTVGQQFLRGHQLTDAKGAARFTTIYPGWYAGRAVHIHFKIRTAAPGGQAYEFTSQLFFPEPMNDEVHAQAPYSKKGRRDMTNERDGIYRSSGGQLLLKPTAAAGRYDATFAIALDLSDAAVGRPDGGRGRGRGRGGLG
jgi:protocatechuate 3,4-dioxygenase beta subunit